MSERPGVALHQIFSREVRQTIKFGKMRGQWDLKLMKKEVNWIKNWDKNWCKMETIDAKSSLFKLDQLYVHVSLELNVIDTNWLFLQQEGVNQIWLHHTIGTKSDWQSQKWGSSLWNLPTMPKHGSTPLPHERSMYF